MANEQNLVPQAHKLTVEDQSKGGKKSVQVRKAKKSREERMRFIFDLAVTNPKILKNLESMGIDATEMDIETAMDARMALEALKGNVNAYRAQKEEAYGKAIQQNKDEVEISGEIKGINIIVKDYKEKDD
jgi:hypothetical protein